VIHASDSITDLRFVPETEARWQGALAPQLPRATRSSRFQSEGVFSGFEHF